MLNSWSFLIFQNVSRYGFPGLNWCNLIRQLSCWASLKKSCNRIKPVGEGSKTSVRVELVALYLYLHCLHKWLQTVPNSRLSQDQRRLSRAPKALGRDSQRGHHVWGWNPIGSRCVECRAHRRSTVDVVICGHPVDQRWPPLPFVICRTLPIKQVTSDCERQFLQTKAKPFLSAWKLSCFSMCSIFDTKIEFGKMIRSELIRLIARLNAISCWSRSAVKTAPVRGGKG